jgi:DNA-binding NarL/FixJ family response regulator
MLPKRIILANDTHFFRDAFRRVIEKKSNLQVAAEVKDLADLPSVVQETHPDWIIISLPTDGNVAEPIEQILIDHPYIHIIAVAKDGSRIRVEWMEHREQEVENLSLDDFIDLLNIDPYQAQDLVAINP